MHKCKLCSELQNNYIYTQSEEHSLKVIFVKITIKSSLNCRFYISTYMFLDEYYLKQVRENEVLLNKIK